MPTMLEAAAIRLFFALLRLLMKLLICCGLFTLEKLSSQK
jgi:hypothetical protein